MREPRFRQFDLETVMDLLPKHAVHVADAVAVSRYVNRRHRLHETRRQPAQAAIAQRSVGFEFTDQVEFDAERGQRLPHLLH